MMNVRSLKTVGARLSFIFIAIIDIEVPRDYGEGVKIFDKNAN